MSFIKEFKEFAVRGNVIDLAVGVIVGGAFGKIVTSLVNDIIMPPIGRVLGNVNFKDLYYPLDHDKIEALGPGKHALAEAANAGIAVIAYGQFINTLIDFLIVSFCIFLLVKGINLLRRAEEKKPEPERATKACPYCLSDIPAQASRCAHCTSRLEDGESHEGELQP
ncbi:large conductance mechanosensitive channel [Paenibacillus shirakamiensis]|uniref:Large-conductance mechanosensitive channel n=1 Tax=Paenibacillus shirakamiensis TaxID=1265935 RepID=A0ABS4JKZ3_9BACL|nr:large conductance mechanosensitive channel protein MscL [Paenibacillus shirakamiensis]MBP2001641.1 large conductance mechanosensitive channel [Paenibacillus shirakamiensis]